MADETDDGGRDHHRWTTRFAIALSCIIAAFGTWGWLTHFGIIPPDYARVAGGLLMAGVCLVAQGMCNNMAVEARRARAQGLGWSFHAATVVALGFGAISAMGLHHGWEIARTIAPAVDIPAAPDWLMTTLFVFLAMGEPASFWIVEAVRGGRAPAFEKPATEAPAGSSAAWSPRVVEATHQKQALTKPKRAAGVVAAALAVGVGGLPTINPQPVGFPDQISVAEPTLPAAQDHDVVALANAGWSERRIAEHVGRTRHAVRKALGRPA